MKTIFDFTNLYPLSKTLRFELKPVGETLKNIKQSKILMRDSEMADSYIKVKKIIDSYHKTFIEKVLSKSEIKLKSDDKKDSLEEYAMLFSKSALDENEKEQFLLIQKNLRKQIADFLKKDDTYGNLFKQELIKNDLLDFVKKEEEKDLIRKFNKFTTYFKGFNENRKNIYSSEEQSTAISYRLINENLPKFIYNIEVFRKLIETSLKEELNELYFNFREDLKSTPIKEIFDLKYFNKVITQSQISIYNMLIGGKTIEENSKIKGLNEYINLYNQKQDDRNKRLPKMKMLFKQILSDKEALSWLPESFSSDSEVLDSIEQYYRSLKDVVFSKSTDEKLSLKNLLEEISKFDDKGIYIKTDSLSYVSQSHYGSWGDIEASLRKDYEIKSPRGVRESMEKYDERKKNAIKSKKNYSIAEIDLCLKNLYGDEKKSLGLYFSSFGNNESEKAEDYQKKIENSYLEITDLINSADINSGLSQDGTKISKIKAFLDNIMQLMHFIKPLTGGLDEIEKDNEFYNQFARHWEQLSLIVPLYNMVRNYMTQKPYSTKKIKLNFDNSTLLAGWDLNKEKDNTSVILRKDGLYYLAIMDKKHNKVFEPEEIKKDGDCYEKMVYKLVPGASKMLPKLYLSKKWSSECPLPPEMANKYKQKTHIKGENFNIQDCRNLIDFSKKFISQYKDWSAFSFNFSDTEKYQSIDEFYKEVDQQGYRISFTDVSKTYIDNLVKEGKIYLFQIYNKDFSPHSKGTPNMHTLYWKMLFDKTNLEDVVFKLGGEAEVFYRKASIKVSKPTHPAKMPIKNKNKKNPVRERILHYDLIKDKRYTEDKFLFHVPITLNFKSSNANNINNLVREHLKDSDNYNIIGIDRGERHLLYLVVIDKNGKILEQTSLNNIINKHDGITYTTDYHELLDQKEKDRSAARQNWQTIENIKELKAGYLSQVVHKVAQLMVKHNAIVILEDLNRGFIRSRFKIEKQIYQKFEKMLIDKLNFYADKNILPHRSGGVLKALQLTEPWSSFKKLGKQSGFLFYVPAWNTSKIDPRTGFVDLFNLHYENIKSSQEFFRKFKKISYNSQAGYYEFRFDYSDFTSKSDNSSKEWTITTKGSRILTFRGDNNNWQNREIDLTEEFNEFFKKQNIDISGDIKEKICGINEKSPFEELYRLLKLTLQMRNSFIGTDIDYLISPVADKNGKFYDSRTAGSELPANADANGAYNIARKGLMIIDRIKKADNIEKLDLSITNKDWLAFAQMNK